ncbi:hypothetical protein FDECE_5166 [Fusarium decemcellulare]|nr:hypothetical protein FDECE_5166 [Fusarium decemcellulare]
MKSVLSSSGSRFMAHASVQLRSREYTGQALVGLLPNPKLAPDIVEATSRHHQLCEFCPRLLFSSSTSPSSAPQLQLFWTLHLNITTISISIASIIDEAQPEIENSTLEAWMATQEMPDLHQTVKSNPFVFDRYVTDLDERQQIIRQIYRVTKRRLDLRLTGVIFALLMIAPIEGVRAAFPELGQGTPITSGELLKSPLFRRTGEYEESPDSWFDRYARAMSEASNVAPNATDPCPFSHHRGTVPVSIVRPLDSLTLLHRNIPAFFRCLWPEATCNRWSNLLYGQSMASRTFNLHLDLRRLWQQGYIALRPLGRERDQVSVLWFWCLHSRMRRSDVIQEDWLHEGWATSVIGPPPITPTARHIQTGLRYVIEECAAPAHTIELLDLQWTLTRILSLSGY